MIFLCLDFDGVKSPGVIICVEAHSVCGYNSIEEKSRQREKSEGLEKRARLIL